MEIIIFIICLIFLFIELKYIHNLINKTNNIDNFISNLTEDTKLSTIKSPAFKSLRYELLVSIRKFRLNIKYGILSIIFVLIIIGIYSVFISSNIIQSKNDEINSTLKTEFFKQVTLKEKEIDSLKYIIKSNEFEIDTLKRNNIILNENIIQKDKEIKRLNNIVYKYVLY